MNALENKAIDLALKEMQKAVGDIENIRYRIRFLTDEKCNIKTTAEELEKECNRIVDKNMHSINEWLHALKNNNTR